MVSSSGRQAGVSFKLRLATSNTAAASFADGTLSPENSRCCKHMLQKKQHLCGTDTVAKLSLITHETRRLSDGYVEGVEAVWHRAGAINAT